MKIERKAGIIVRDDKVLCKNRFVPMDKLSTRNVIHLYESVAKAEAATEFHGGTAIEATMTIEIPGGTNW